MEDATKAPGPRSTSLSRAAPPPAADTRAFARRLGTSGGETSTAPAPRPSSTPPTATVFAEAAGTGAERRRSAPPAFNTPPLATVRSDLALRSGSGAPASDRPGVMSVLAAEAREAKHAGDSAKQHRAQQRQAIGEGVAQEHARMGQAREGSRSAPGAVPAPQGPAISTTSEILGGPLPSESLADGTGDTVITMPPVPSLRPIGTGFDPGQDVRRSNTREASTQAGPGHVKLDLRTSTAAQGDALATIEKGDATPERTYRPTEGFALDMESGRPIPPIADKLSVFAVGDKIARAHLTDVVKTHEMSDALTGLFDRPQELALPAQIAKLETCLNALIASAPGLGGSSVAGDSSGGDTILQGDSPRLAGRDPEGRIQIWEQPPAKVNVTNLQALQQTLATQMQTLHERIEGAGDGTGLRQLKDNMLMTGAREKVHEHTRPLAGIFASGERNTLGDGVKRNIMGKEAHAVLIRSLLQAAITTGGTYGVQKATSEWLKTHFEGNPDQIPNPVLDAARKALGGQATLSQVRNKAIEELSKPGSTYIDETKATEAMIVYLETGLGFGRGTIIPVADSINETDAKKEKVKSAIDTAEEPKVTKTAGEKANAAMANAFKPQLVANMLSGAVAAVAQAGSSIANNEKAGAALLEMGKTMTFAGVTTASNIAADGIRARHDGGQFEKAFLRTVFRTIAQATKTGISIGESGLKGTMGARAPASDWVRAGMQGFVGSIVKEGAGSAAQATVDALLPANEVAMLKVGKTISAASDVLRTLNEIEETGKPLLDESVVEGARAEIRLALERIYDVNNADFGSDKFNYAFQDYASNVNRVIVTQLDGAEHPDPTERNVAGTSNPTRRDAARTQT